MPQDKNIEMKKLESLSISKPHLKKNRQTNRTRNQCQSKGIIFQSFFRIVSMVEREILKISRTF